jgi:hypothetical protein
MINADIVFRYMTSILNVIIVLPILARSLNQNELSMNVLTIALIVLSVGASIMLIFTGMTKPLQESSLHKNEKQKWKTFIFSAYMIMCSVSLILYVSTSFVTEQNLSDNYSYFYFDKSNESNGIAPWMNGVTNVSIMIAFTAIFMLNVLISHIGLIINVSMNE